MIGESAKTTASRSPLEELRVGISGAVPERQFWGSVPDLDRLIVTFVAQLSALVIRYGGTVVHGSQPSLTPVVAEQARRQARKGTSCLKLFASQLFGDLPDVTWRAARRAEAEVVLCRQVGKGDFSDRETRNSSLTAMRIAMTLDVDVVVAVGGKLHLDTGFNPGVLEELAQAHWLGVPCFIVGAFGGTAGRLDSSVLEELSAGNLLGAEDVRSVKMATWTDTMDEYVGKLMTHFARHRERFAKSRQLKYRLPAVESSTRTEEAIHVSLVKPASVVTVDPRIVKEWSVRFAELMSAVERSDSDRTRKLLRQTHV